MFQIRIHGRGGQGVVTAAELLSVAAFQAGRHAQAFPSFGSERTGAPVVSYCRIDDRPIRLREPISDPDALIVQDASLIAQINVFSGVREGATILINSERTLAELGIEDTGSATFVVLPATQIALAHIGRPVPNAVLLGGFSAATDQLNIEDVIEAITERFPGRIAAGNIEAAREAASLVGEMLTEARDG
ncbi:MAG: 2-oxoacid:acceptor oxidoreductase family protein [Actinobacteria bacterium]|nr:2-oxoacid:acceptor oxidoreductase family protein [Actinomycetota bacterium]